MVFKKKLRMENLPKIAAREKMGKPDISKRMAYDMKPVLMRAEEVVKNEIYYTVFRNLKIVSGKIRYDITQIPQNKIAGELAKTFGHYHKSAYPELYEVLDGRAYFLLQKFSNNPTEISEAYIVEAEAGEKAVMPPGFGHLSINIGGGDLILANWISLVEYDYQLFSKFHGGCYYVLNKGENIEFEKNPNYKSVPELKKLKLRDLPDLGIKNDKERPIWDLYKTPEKLDWLVNPEKYMDLLTIEKLYREI